MKLTQRFKQLTIWRKIGVYGSLASILALLLFFLPDEGEGNLSVDSGRDAIVITDSTIIFDRVQPPAHSDAETREAGPTTEPITKETTPAETSLLSLLEFFETQDALEGRFLELDEFLDQLQGKEVIWRGFVAHVTGDRVRIRVGNDGQSTRGAWVTLGSSWRTKLFSLRKGDEVEIRGLFQSGGPLWANLDGLSLAVIDSSGSAAGSAAEQRGR